MQIYGEEYFSVADAARLLGVTRQAVRNAIYQKSLNAEWFLGRHVILESELKRYVAEKRPVGRPKKPVAE